MEDRLPDSFLPEKMRILSGSALKMIAIITMLIDHSALMLLTQYEPAMRPLFSLNGTTYSLYRICRDIGRVAFPIFCFLLIEGFLHTRNRLRYGRNLLLFALISEIPWNLMHSNTWTHEKQNVFFTLFLGYLACWAIEYFWENQVVILVSLLALLCISINLNADYGWRGFVFIVILYVLRTDKPAQAIIGSCWLYYEWKACFAFVSINMYNGKRGFIRGKWMKYFFYLFYPVHIAVLVILRNYLFHP